MPLPKPKKKENKNDFIDRCMSDPVMNKEYPDNKQRYSICNSIWKEKKMENKKEIEVKDAKCRGLSLQVPVSFAKDDKKSDVDFIMEAYTGQVVDRWWGKLAIDIDGIKAKKNIPIFRDHMRGNIVGYSSDTWKAGSFFVSGKFSGATQHAAEVKALAQEGFPWQASIGVIPLKILSIEDKTTHEVNGKKIKGPAEVWLESQVFETSFVPLGGDNDTSVSVFSKFDEIEQSQAGGKPAERNEEMSEKNQMPVILTIEILKADHKELVAQLLAEGTTAERERIKAVLDQSMPGHESLINQLAFDGKTTGPEAAVQILAAEKKIRGTAAQNLKDDAVNPVKHSPTPEVENKTDLSDDKDKPIEERAKAKWDKDAELRSEFDSDFDAFKAYFEATEKGHARLLRGKDK